MSNQQWLLCRKLKGERLQQLPPSNTHIPTRWGARAKRPIGLGRRSAPPCTKKATCEHGLSVVCSSSAWHPWLAAPAAGCDAACMVGACWLRARRPMAGTWLDTAIDATGDKTSPPATRHRSSHRHLSLADHLELQRLQGGQATKACGPTAMRRVAGILGIVYGGVSAIGAIAVLHKLHVGEGESSRARRRAYICLAGGGACVVGGFLGASTADPRYLMPAVAFHFIACGCTAGCCTPRQPPRRPPPQSLRHYVDKSKRVAYTHQKDANSSNQQNSREIPVAEHALEGMLEFYRARYTKLQVSARGSAEPRLATLWYHSRMKPSPSRDRGN